MTRARLGLNVLGRVKDARMFFADDLLASGWSFMHAGGTKRREAYERLVSDLALAVRDFIEVQKTAALDQLFMERLPRS